MYVGNVGVHTPELGRMGAEIAVKSGREGEAITLLSGVLPHKHYKSRQAPPPL